MALAHQAVLLEEAVDALMAATTELADQVFVDGTFGRGGHSARILERLSRDDRLIAFDKDPEAARVAEEMAGADARFSFLRGSFAELERAGSDLSGVFLDLGVSSPQLDDRARGFSFQLDGPLDMRMDRRQPVTAEQLVNELEPEELAEIFWKLGGERKSRRIARAIVEQRSMQRLETTLQLAEVVERACPRRGARAHPATGVFQALRMAVNDELGQVGRGLEAGWSVLKPGGRMAVITFHSGEDRAVKQFSRDLARPYTVRGEVDLPELREQREPLARELSRKAIKPSEAELDRNPRSRSAQLRVLEKI